eukprot:GEMP01021055.1.p1 GENE.GEMP01021055.1~~GEMP01021055.1.p1  ORF type:complete len:642 (+),score=205.47 GEMP01021055.1:188-2113(+)
MVYLWWLFLATAVVSHPIQDVISMIQDLQVSAKKDQERDDIDYENTTHEYQVAKKEAEKNIKIEQNKLEEASNLATAKQNEVDALSDQIKELKSKLVANAENEESIGNAREKENGVFLATEETLKGTITAVEECLVEFAKGTGLLSTTRKEQVSLIAQAYMTPKDARVVSSFLEQPADPEARVYDSKTGTVVQLFEKLLRKFTDKLNDKQKQEHRAINAHALSTQALNGESSAMNNLKDEKKTQKGEAEGVRDQAQKDATDAQTALNEFTKSLQDTERQFKDSTNEHALISKERREEVEAMTQAVEVLETVAGVRADHVKLGNVTSFLQIEAPKDKAMALLRSVAAEMHSAQLQKLIMQLSVTKAGHFDQINNMIQKMIDRLAVEQRKEDDHKAWCDNELNVTNAAKDDKSAKLEKIEADTQTATSKRDQNTEDKQDAQEQISDLQQRKAAEIERRHQQKRNNNVSLEDAKKAQEGLQKALQILNQWKQGKDTSVSTTSGNDKVFELLEGAQAHYAQMQADVESAESTQQTDHATSLADAKRSVSTLEAQIQGHEDHLNRLSQKLSTLAEKRKHTSDALFEVKQYLNDLKPACVSEDGAYEKRKELRQKEKDALTEAKKTLANAFKEELVEVRKHGFLAVF